MSGYDHQLINNTVYDNIYGIRSGYQNILRDNYLNDNSDYGISLYAKDGCILTGNRFSSCYLEIAGSLYEVSSHIISPNNTVNGKAIGYYVSLYNTSITTLSEQLILANCSFTTISGLNLSGGWKGLWLVKSNNNTIQGNSLLSNQKYGIHSSQSFNNTFTNNIINNSSIGFKIENSGNNIMDLNTITNNARGIYLNRDIGNRIKNSHINFNDIGIEILGSLQNYIHNNSLIGNGNGIKVNSAIFSDISEFNFIYNNTATNGDVGISLPDGSRNNEVINNSVNLNEFGISITSFSNNNLIKENYVEYNSYAGIYLSQAEFNTIINNTVTHNYYGIDISNSIRNNITKNTVNSNQYGLYLSGCLNEITWNLFIDNCEGIYVFDTSCNIIYQNTVINRDCEQPIPSFTWILMLFSLMCLIMVIQRKNSWLGKKK